MGSCFGKEAGKDAAERAAAATERSTAEIRRSLDRICSCIEGAAVVATTTFGTTVVPVCQQESASWRKTLVIML